MKRDFAKQIVDLVNHPQLKVFKVHESDPEGWGKYEVGVETQWGLIYWRRNYLDDRGNPHLKDGFTLMGVSSLIEPLFSVLWDIANILDLPTYRWDSGGNWDFRKEIKGLEELRSLPDYYSHMNSGDLEKIAATIREKFIPECNEYLTYRDLYNKHFEIAGEQLIFNYDSEKGDAFVDTGTAEHYRLILKAILKTDDFELFRDILFGHYSPGQKKMLQPYLEELEKLYRDNSFSRCDTCIAPRLPYHKIEDIISAEIKVQSRILEIYESWLPEAIASRQRYDASEVPDEKYHKMSYLNTTLRAPENFLISTYLPRLIRLKIWHKALRYLQSNSEIEIEELLSILDNTKWKDLVKTCQEEVREHAAVNKANFDDVVAESIEDNQNNFYEKSIYYNNAEPDSIWYHYQLSQNHRKLMQT